MKQPPCVIWALTRKNNCNLVKFNKNMWSNASTNATGFHNATQTASPVSVQASRVSTKKQWRRVFTLKQAHGQHNGAKKIVKSGLTVSDIPCKEMKHARKGIAGMMHVNNKSKVLALRRLARCHAANRSTTQKADVTR